MAQSIIMGILAHVDAGKTTLSEVLLYRSGAIRRQGRVDNKDTFLDTNAMEREHGIRWNGPCRSWITRWS